MRVADFRTKTVEERQKILAGMSDKEAAVLMYDWQFWARSEQEQPAELGREAYVWLVLAGRGYGKTRMMAEWFRKHIESGHYKYTSIAGATADDVREIMIEGESGLLNICPPWFYPNYQPSKKKITWPNGVETLIFYGSEPDGPRGKQQSLVWCDELAKWKYPEDTLDNILFGLRLGDNPLCAITTTPRPIKVIKELIGRPDVIVTRGNTHDNEVNLPAVFINTIISKYEGTRLGRQEINGEILDDNPGALWKREWIDASRVTAHPDLDRVVVAVDPQAASPSNKETAETGIVGVGRGKAMPGMPYQNLPHFYVLDDLSVSATPEGWGRQTVTGYHKLMGDKIVGEKNNGGEMVRSTIHNVDREVPVSLVWASRGKEVRAEPISALYEQGRVHHVGSFITLEDQLCEWEPGLKSPDRLDALVWGITDMMTAPVIPAPSPTLRTERTKSKVMNLPL